MFTEPTVLILGAGGSWHYGYPTGEDLVQQLIMTAGIAEKFFRMSNGNVNMLNQPGTVNQCGSFLLLRYMRNRDELPQHDALSYVDAWTLAADDCQEFKRRLISVAPPVIDSFLLHNIDLQYIGKILIAWAILECEAIHAEFGLNTNKTLKQHELLSGLTPIEASEDGQKIQRTKREFDQTDNWYRHLFHKLMPTTESDLNSNNVFFVTFNYDVSLELYLKNALKNTSRFRHEEIEEFISSDRFIHVYGSVRDPQDSDTPMLSSSNFNEFRDIESRMLNENRLAYYDACRVSLDKIYASSQRLRTIGGCDKTEDAKAVSRAKNAIENAENIYILGYGFDRSNSDIINLPAILGNNSRGVSNDVRQKCNVHFTNFNNHNAINKRARDVFHVPRDAFSLIKPYADGTDITRTRFYEQSHKDVYRALCQDFDW